MSTWMVTGGAGYIGSHVVEAFRAQGIGVVVVDDLSSGHEAFVPADVPFVRTDVQDREAVAAALDEHRVQGVVHLAGFKYAGVSVTRPLHTYTQNVTGTVALLQAMADAGTTDIVFSSSAAVYGTPTVDLVTETTPTLPESPYGESKLVGEWLLRDQARALEGTSTPLRHTSLRYFNVVGSGHDHLYDTSPHNLFPLVLDALVQGRTPTVFGTDYPTPDGTCVRDYVHVADLATSHVAAARALEGGHDLAPVYNLGSGDGVSVRQIMSAVASVTGTPFTPQEAPRRPGDPARIVASGELAARDLDWQMRHTLEQMVESAWRARQAAEAATP
ncbi:UDP-glucose 4-epimerase GalE [Cellulomonas bogoriensis]|uniref:UDP-glucose 4-epimerase n=1 Tax=Cellulomonas bogoriensis 69B4 = DSM 16987 TaxID=1386082 RepID=A0A0A0C1Y1_9CELL|nr:UDP-glucose 4-epimerase GalE [Cellulomonas bogoriensis]KGM14186.1 UDP-glucose 4-epimerase [Cellulomonas bogoriensis 69B4 = DSM 16987]